MASALDALVADLRTIFSLRLSAVVLYGRHAVGPAPPGALAHTLVLVRELGLADLEACARRVPAWRRSRVAVPLLLLTDEFERSLDAFPAEFGAILSAYRVLYGGDPFDGLSVDPVDLRRACEVEARGHLLHLREGFLECGGDPDQVNRLVDASAAALRALLVNLIRLDGTSETTPSAYASSRLGAAHGRVIASILSTLDAPLAVTDAARGFPEYLAAIEALVDYVDHWTI
jgi:hypothetical protein